jgi:hypothetical protein
MPISSRKERKMMLEDEVDDTGGDEEDAVDDML